MFATDAYGQETAPSQEGGHGAEAPADAGHEAAPADAGHAAGTEVPHEDGMGGGFPALRFLHLPVADPLARDHLRAVLPVPEEGDHAAPRATSSACARRASLRTSSRRTR